MLFHCVLCFQRQSDGVDAVTGIGRGGITLPVEDMSQVGAASGTADLGAHHAVGEILVQGHRGTVYRIIEARPPALGVEFVFGTEEFRPAGPAAVDALGCRRHVFAAPRWFCGTEAEYGKRFRVEDRPPFFFGSLDRWILFAHG